MPLTIKVSESLKSSYKDYYDRLTKAMGAIDAYVEEVASNIDGTITSDDVQDLKKACMELESIANFVNPWYEG